MANVFDKLDAAEKAHRGITLDSFELWLLMDQASEAISIAGSKYTEWEDFSKEHRLMKRKNDELPDAG